MEQMQQSSPRVPKKEPWPGITHDLGNFPSLLRGVAMNRASSTYGFPSAKKTCSQPLLCICQQQLAGQAKSFFRLMFPPAIHTDHFLNCFSLLPNSSVHRPLLYPLLFYIATDFIITDLPQNTDDKKHKSSPEGLFFISFSV